MNDKKLLIRILEQTTVWRELHGRQHEVTLLPGARVECNTVVYGSNFHTLHLTHPMLPEGAKDTTPGIFNWNIEPSVFRAVDTPWYPQTDNKIQPMRTCNTSSNAMLVGVLRPHRLKPTSTLKEDDVFWQAVNKYGDTTDHKAVGRALEDYGVRSQFHYNWGFADLDAQLAKGIPTVVGILHRGSEEYPAGGHIILVLRKDPSSGGYFCHDPFGSVYDGYQGNVENGRGVLYSRKTLQNRWLVSPMPNAKTGWARQVSTW